MGFVIRALSKEEQIIKKCFREVSGFRIFKKMMKAGVKRVFALSVLTAMAKAFMANLKPAKLMGVESQGMILAAGEFKSLEVLEIKEAPLGSPVA